MAEDNQLGKRGKALEDEYFHKKEKELIEKLRRRAAEEAKRKELSEVAGTQDHDILQTLQELGHTRDTVGLLHLVPLIHVAWADGKMNEQERELIIEAAKVHGVVAGSTAFQLLTEWLNNRPSEEFFAQTLTIVGAILQANPEAALEGSDVLTRSIQVAEASGGILGFGNKISDEEKAILERIARALGKSAA